MGFGMKEIKLCARESKHSEIETLCLFHRVTWNFFTGNDFFRVTSHLVGSLAPLSPLPLVRNGIGTKWNLLSSYELWVFRTLWLRQFPHDSSSNARNISSLHPEACLFPQSMLLSWLKRRLLFLQFSRPFGGLFACAKRSAFLSGNAREVMLAMISPISGNVQISIAFFPPESTTITPKGKHQKVKRRGSLVLTRNKWEKVVR